MRSILPVLLAFFLAAEAAARQPEWRWAAEQEVVLRPYEYVPPMLLLPAGEPVRLRLYNGGGGTLVFEAKDFFRAAHIRERDASKVTGGRVRLAPGEAETIALVPAPGRYRVRSSNLIHRLLGMTGRIVVE